MTWSCLDVVQQFTEQAEPIFRLALHVRLLPDSADPQAVIDQLHRKIGQLQVERLEAVAAQVDTAATVVKIPGRQPEVGSGDR